MSNDSLRQELQKIFNPTMSNEQAIIELDRLKNIHNHKILITQSLEDFEKEFSENFNCFEYAFGLNTSKQYKETRRKLASSHMRGIFCNSCFIQWLIKNKKLDPNVYKGDEAIIIYSSLQEGIKHAGIFKDTQNDDSLIISKFGTGHVYEHAINEVPTSYGNIQQFYKRPSQEEVETFFTEYLQFVKVRIDELFHK